MQRARMLVRMRSGSPTRRVGARLDHAQVDRGCGEGAMLSGRVGWMISELGADVPMEETWVWTSGCVRR